MNSFSVTIDGKVYLIEPALQEGIYTVTSGGQSVMIGKEAGEWKIYLPTTAAVDFPYEALFRAAEENN
jgi:hypothetical protein